MGSIGEMLSYEFMRRAVISAVLIGTSCSLVGVFVVLRSLSFIGVGLAHAAFAGVCLAFLLGFEPNVSALVFSLIMVWLVGAVGKKSELKPDAAIGIMFSVTMGLAILFIGLMRQYNADLYGYLFGNILGVTDRDLLSAGIVCAIVLILIRLLFKEYQFIAFDEEMAEAAGIPTGALSLLLLTLIAVTVVTSLRAVGSILVTALIVIPAAGAYQLTHNLKAMALLSVAFGVAGSLLGLFASYWFEVPSGATIVIVLTLIFALCSVFSPKRRRLRART
jgi:ABC-type Mn2+/Zn2+ transport system permease subunit